MKQIFTSEQNCPLLKFSSLLNWMHHLWLGNWGPYMKWGRLLTCINLGSGEYCTELRRLTFWKEQGQVFRELETASLCGLWSLRIHCSARKGTCYFHLSSRFVWSISTVLPIVFQDKGKIPMTRSQVSITFYKHKRSIIADSELLAVQELSVPHYHWTYLIWPVSNRMLNFPLSSTSLIFYLFVLSNPVGQVAVSWFFGRRLHLFRHT